MDRETLRAWQAHPVTAWLLGRLSKDRQQCQIKALEASDQPDLNPYQVLREVAYNRGRVSIIEEIEQLEVDDE